MLLNSYIPIFNLKINHRILNQKDFIDTRCDLSQKLWILFAHHEKTYNDLFSRLSLLNLGLLSGEELVRGKSLEIAGGSIS